MDRAVDRVSGGMAAPADVQVVVGAVVLGVAVAALVVVVVLALVLLRRRSAPPAPPASAAVPDRQRDDLPGFFSSPPGSPGAPVPGDPGAPPVPLGTGPGLLVPPPARATAPAAPVGRRSSAPGGYALGLVVLALLLVIAVALVGLFAGGGQKASRPASGASAPAPALPSVPAAPAPGQPGAGALADLSLPPGEGTVARVTFAPVVLARYPVGVTVTTPTVSVTTAGRTALAHVRLPTFNCLAPAAPPDPIAADCVPSVTEYADLAAPALSASSSGRGLRIAGRFPTYTRPAGAEPVYTGHAYDLAVTVRPGDRTGGRRGTVDGVLTLGGEIAQSTGTDQDVLRRGR